MTELDGRGGGTSPSAGGPRRLWWWLPVVAIALVVAVILVRGGDEGEAPQGAGVETPELEPADPIQAETGSITIDGEPAEPLLERGDLSARVGEEVIGTVVPVDSLIAEGVLLVGEGRSQVLLVEPEGDLTPVAPGEVATFRGTLRALDDEVRNAVWGAEAEPRIEAQGVYVAVEELVAEAAPEEP